MFYIDIHKICLLNNTSIVADCYKLNIRTVIQAKSLCSVWSFKISLIPHPSISGINRILHSVHRFQVKIIRLSYFVYAAQIVTGNLHIYKTINFILVQCFNRRIFNTFCCRTKRYIFIRISGKDFRPFCLEMKIFVWHNAAGCIFFVCKFINPANELIAVASRRRQLSHQFTSGKLHVFKFSLTAI